MPQASPATAGVIAGVSAFFLLIASLFSSSFGIFVSGDNGIRSVMAQLEREFQDSITAICDEVPHDELAMDEYQFDWVSVLAVYAVRVAADPEDPVDVATMDDAREQLLRQVFWDMNEIHWNTEIYEIPAPEDPYETEPPATEPTETEPYVPTHPTIPIYTPLALTASEEPSEAATEPAMIQQTRLIITFSCRTADEMADRYSFTEEQREQLAELLADSNQTLWSALLYGTSGGNSDIVSVAASQVGSSGGATYWSWFGFTSRVEWCACFVSWCANECGFIDAGLIPRFSSCVQGAAWFAERGQWADGGYTPSPGDLIFFDWTDGVSDGIYDHVGIVEYVADGRVYTIEGNRDDAVGRYSYSLDWDLIAGYGIPAYN